MSGDAVVQVVEPHEKRKGYLKSTHWSIGHWSDMQEKNPELPWHLLEHVNCSYLSTPFRPPSLLALKQHAQSLAVMISLLAPSSNSAEIDNENSQNTDRTFKKNQAFDWLNNLQVHYHNDDEAHSFPLNSLLNHVESNSDIDGPRYHCPLHTLDIDFPEKHPNQQKYPFSSHMNLLMHANECMERLDHEYSAMGGILAILPLDSEKADNREELNKAKKTLVGQWILFTQHLVARMHELEISYANSIDLLANEAVIPPQHISSHGPDGRSGREIVFPQDRWILANAGDDVFNYIHQELDQKEAYLNKKDNVYKDQGVMGGAVWVGDDEQTRGIVQLDMSTRFYRIKDSGHGPIFVLPAFAERPGTEHAREIENRATVVTVPAPNFPNRLTAWESKMQDAEHSRVKQTLEIARLKGSTTQLEQMNKMLDTEVKRLNFTLRAWEQNSTSANQQEQSLANQVGAAAVAKEQVENELKQVLVDREKMAAELNVFKASNKVISGNLEAAGPPPPKAMAVLMEAVEDATQGINKTWSVIEDLGQKGVISIDDFKWMSKLFDANHEQKPAIDYALQQQVLKEEQAKAKANQF